MLVLGRRAGEAIRIGADILVTVVETARGYARIGVDAPRELPVSREPAVQPIKNPANDLMRCSPGGAVEVAVDEGHCIVVHAPGGTFTVTDVDAFVGALHAARRFRNDLERMRP